MFSRAVMSSLEGKTDSEKILVWNLYSFMVSDLILRRQQLHAWRLSYSFSAETSSGPRHTQMNALVLSIPPPPGWYLIISMYSLSLPLLSLHLRYMTDASTLAGEKVLGSFRREMTLSRIVLVGGGGREEPTEEGKWQGRKNKNTLKKRIKDTKMEVRKETKGKKG